MNGSGFTVTAGKGAREGAGVGVGILSPPTAFVMALRGAVCRFSEYGPEVIQTCGHKPDNHVRKIHVDSDYNHGCPDAFFKNLHAVPWY
jgi:hypothetical protein